MREVFFSRIYSTLVATLFHVFWEAGHDSEACPVGLNTCTINKELLSPAVTMGKDHVDILDVEQVNLIAAERTK